MRHDGRRLAVVGDISENSPVILEPDCGAPKGPTTLLAVITIVKYRRRRSGQNFVACVT